MSKMLTTLRDAILMALMILFFALVLGAPAFFIGIQYGELRDQLRDPVPVGCKEIHLEGRE